LSDDLGSELHLAVFDCNIYLDVARILGAPFSWARFNAEAAKSTQLGVPADDRRVDALRAVAVSMSGRFAGPHLLEVWTSNHIDDLVWRKAVQDLGWSTEDASGLVEDLVREVVYDRSGGGSVGDVQIAWGCPPLDHEDGCVYATSRDAGEAGVASSVRYCITNDRGFREQAPFSNVVTLYAWEWVELVRASRRRLAMRNLPRPGGV
jgi:hypothetical protein